MQKARNYVESEETSRFTSSRSGELASSNAFESYHQSSVSGQSKTSVYGVKSDYRLLVKGEEI